MTAEKRPDPTAGEVAARELVRLAQERGLSRTGPGALLGQFARNVLETALDEEGLRATRPVEEVYAAIFLDAIVVEIGDGQVVTRPVHAAVGVSLAGETDVLGLWAGPGGGGATFTDECAH